MTFHQNKRQGDLNKMGANANNYAYNPELEDARRQESNFLRFWVIGMACYTVVN